MQSNPVTAPAGTTTDFGQIIVCGSQLENFIRVTVDGVTAVYAVATALPDMGQYLYLFGVKWWRSFFYYFSPTNDKTVFLDVAGTAVGSYGGSSGNTIVSIVNTPLNWSFHYGGTFDNFEITEYGANIGDEIIGNFSAH
ncbi:MAG: hypothetical protein IPN76_23410 [Saprospiraceae bacterium]|nr:hypothetical protein [Saprospiraceae bacterium]